MARWFLGAATVCGLALFGTASGAAEALKVCTTEWPPFTVGSEGAAVSGVHTAAITEAFKRLDHPVKIENVSWDRCWKEVEKGTYDVIYSASFKPERAESTLYPKVPLQTLSYVAVIRKGTAHTWDGKDAAKLPQPIASPRGFSITSDLKKTAGAQIDDGALKDVQNLQKLLIQRVGSVVVEATVAKVLLTQLKAEDKLEILAAPVQSGKDYFVVVSRKFGGSPAAAQALVDRLDPVLADLAKEGFIADLLAKE